MKPGQFLLSPNGSYKLIMQKDGNLVLYHGSTALWSSQTSGDNGAYAKMQSDGNFVVYYKAVAKWYTNTWGFPGAYLRLQNDNNLVIYQGSRALWDWSAGSFYNKLLPGVTLTAHHLLYSPDHQYDLQMQSDGNLVLYKGSTALWSSQTSGDNGAYAKMQSDGNLVVYYKGVAKWYTNTWGFPGAFLQLQDDSNLVVYQGSRALWDWSAGSFYNKLLPGVTLTAGHLLYSPSHQYDLQMQSDGNLVLYQGSKALWSTGTAGDTGAYAIMQSDGNLVVYYNGAAKWNSGTEGYSGAFLQLQDDSNLVIYQGSTAIWDRINGLLSHPAFDPSKFNRGANLAACAGAGGYWNWYYCNDPSAGGGAGCTAFANGTCGEYGVDIGLPAGTPLYAPESGTISLDGPCAPPNYSCWVPGRVRLSADSGDPYPGVMGFGHVIFQVSAGQHVSAGQEIATVADQSKYGTGWSNHVEFMYSPTGGLSQSAFTGGCGAPAYPCGESPSNANSPWSVLLAIEH